MEQTIKIEAGQVWKRRDGKLQPIAAIFEGETYPVKAGNHLKFENCMCWMPNGRYWSDGLKHSKDLIERVS